MAEKRENRDTQGYTDTPMLVDSGYHVHDSERPQPKIVSSYPDCSPSDATVLFDGTSFNKWTGKNGKVAWKLEKGYMEVVRGAGNIKTRESFGDIQLHLEFTCPVETKGVGQQRGNSGVFLMGRYEIQILDNYNNSTYADGTVGAVYGQYPPLVNAIRKPGEWNSYDILWKCPGFNNDSLVSPACVTVILNGVVLHHNRMLLGQTGHKILPSYSPHPAEGPIELQDHGDPVRFRNIWVRAIEVD